MFIAYSFSMNGMLNQLRRLMFIVQVSLCDEWVLLGKKGDKYL